ncbi:MAG: hypothetical protein AAFQ89_19080, partial [Cyanobacteria bacterium J06626_18]
SKIFQITAIYAEQSYNRFLIKQIHSLPSYSFLDDHLFPASHSRKPEIVIRIIIKRYRIVGANAARIFRSLKAFVGEQSLCSSLAALH